jgi:hypothetical protein
LPFGGAVLEERKPQDLGRILEQIQTYTGYRKKADISVLSLYTVQDVAQEAEKDVGF